MKKKREEQKGKKQREKEGQKGKGKKREKGKISLRRAQFRLAEKSAAMAIFLGKNYLGQRDAVETEFNPQSLQKARELLEGVESAIN